MRTSIGKWGTSCAIRLPKMATETLGFKEGQSLEMVINKDGLLLKKAKPKYTLEELVAQMDGCEQSALDQDDYPMGSEVI